MRSKQTSDDHPSQGVGRMRPPHCRHKGRCHGPYSLDSAAWVTTPRRLGRWRSSVARPAPRPDQPPQPGDHRLQDRGDGPHQCVNFKFGIDSNMPFSKSQCSCARPALSVPPAGAPAPSAGLAGRSPGLSARRRQGRQTHPKFTLVFTCTISSSTCPTRRRRSTPANKEKVAEQLKLHQHTFSPWSSCCLIRPTTCSTCPWTRAEKVPLPSRLMVRTPLHLYCTVILPEAVLSGALMTMVTIVIISVATWTSRILGLLVRRVANVQGPCLGLCGVHALAGIKYRACPHILLFPSSFVHTYIIFD